MEIFLDNKELTLSNHPDNLEGIMQEVMTNFLNDERIVWTLKLNGQNYSESTPHDALKIGIDDINSLEIGTKEKKEIVLNFLTNGDELIRILNESAIKISGLFRLSDIQEANKHYMLFLESYQYFFQMIQEGINSLLPEFQEIIIEGCAISLKVDALKKLFNDMISSQEKEDWIMLADLLEYELVPLLKEWNKFLLPLKKML